MSILSNDQISFFDEHGWLIVRGVVAADELLELQTAADELLGSAASAGLVPPPTPYGPPVVQLPNAPRRHPTLLRFLLDGPVGPLASQVLKCESVQLLQDVLLIKPPHSDSRIEWHDDYSYVHLIVPAKTLVVQVALTDSRPERGGVVLVDGSHKWERFGAAGVDGDRIAAGLLDHLPADLRAQVEPRLTPVVLAAGDVSMHHCYTLHMSEPNRTADYRKVLLSHVFDSTCTLAPDKLPAAATASHFPTDPTGHLSPAHFPLLRRPTPRGGRLTAEDAEGRRGED